LHVVFIRQLDRAIAVQDLQKRLENREPSDLLDVRTPGEYAAAHVPNARLIPLDDLNAEEFAQARTGNRTTVYVLCQSGGRARKAIQKLCAAGFDNCVLVEGGTQAWMDAGFPVSRSEHKGLPLIRQVHIAAGLITAAGATLALTIAPAFAIIPLITGCGLLFAGLSGFCGMAYLLAKMPWNRAPSCAPSSGCSVSQS
jgi:rhodanese-related sulfurtransferase